MTSIRKAKKILKQHEDVYLTGKEFRWQTVRNFIKMFGKKRLKDING